MAAMLVFEQLGLNPDKDKLIVSAFGEMRIISRALETGTIEAALVTGNFTSQFRRAGYHILGELDRVPMMGNAVVVKQSFLQSQRDVLRSFLRAISEAQVFVLSPTKKQSVLRVLTKRLSIYGPGSGRRYAPRSSQAAGQEAFSINSGTEQYPTLFTSTEFESR